MPNSTPNPINDRRSDLECEADLLMSRLIDRAASDEDRQRFDALAAAEPTLWQELSLRLQDMGELEAQVRDATNDGASIELPGMGLMSARLNWAVALSGWAAVIIIALSAVLLVMRQPEIVAQPAPVADVISPVEHYQSYVSAPFVLGEMQPVLVEVESLSDGRVAVHFIRRIEEVAFLDPNQPLPVDEDGALTADAELLRSRESGAGFTN